MELIRPYPQQLCVFFCRQISLITQMLLIRGYLIGAVKLENVPLVIPGKVKTLKPTAEIILESLEMVMTMTTSDPNHSAFSKRFKVPRVIGLAGFTPDIYLDVKERKDHFP